MNTGDRGHHAELRAGALQATSLLDVELQKAVKLLRFPARRRQALGTQSGAFEGRPEGVADLIRAI